MVEGLGSIIWKALDKIPFVEAWRARSAGHRKHDQGKFREVDSILAETALNRLLEEAYRHSITRAALRPIDRYLDWAGLVSNRFLIKDLREKSEKFTRELGGLSGFLAVNIFVVHGNSDSYHFRPDQNSSRGLTTAEDREFFDRRSAELNQRMDKCEAAYRVFREAVKSHLYL